MHCICTRTLTHPTPPARLLFVTCSAAALLPFRSRSYDYLPYPPGTANGFRLDAEKWPGGGVDAYLQAVVQVGQRRRRVRPARDGGMVRWKWKPCTAPPRGSLHLSTELTGLQVLMQRDVGSPCAPVMDWWGFRTVHMCR